MKYILYHANCSDGIAAAYAAWKHFGDAAVYHPMAYHHNLPEIPDGATVYLLDYSRPNSELVALRDRGCTVIVIDHHESAMVNVMQLHSSLREKEMTYLYDWSDIHLSSVLREPLNQKSTDEIEDMIDANAIKRFGFNDESFLLKIYFDTGCSGAVGAWRHFHRSTPLPDLIRYVDDRDRWVWQLPDSEEISEGLMATIDEFRASSLLQSRLEQRSKQIAEFEFLDKLVHDPDYCGKMAQKGRPLVQVRRAEVAELMKAVTWGTIGDHYVPICPAPRHRSWVGHELCKLYPDAPFAATFREKDGVTTVDLRSNNGFRVNRVARKLGGGGHPGAAGFELHRVGSLQPGDRFSFAMFEFADRINVLNPIHVYTFKSVLEQYQSAAQQWCVKLKT